MSQPEPSILLIILHQCSANALCPPSNIHGGFTVNSKLQLGKWTERLVISPSLIALKKTKEKKIITFSIKRSARFPVFLSVYIHLSIGYSSLESSKVVLELS